MDRLNTKGFTLIELMIVITLLGILASIAVPVYNEHTRKAHRATAKSALMENAQYLERYYTTHNTYNDTVTPDPPVLPITTTEGAKYTITLTSTDPTIDFQLTATPAGSQAADSCGTLTINQLGAKTPTTGNCW